MIKKRFIYFGGARETNADGSQRRLGVNDNSAFQLGAQNIAKSYKGEDGVVVIKKITTAKSILSDINVCADNSVLSLDIVCHGSPLSLNFSQKPYRNDGFYSSWLGKIAISRYYSDEDGTYEFTSESKNISEIDFNKFDNAARIQLHGCLTASDWFREANGKKIFPIVVDNIAQEIGDQLHKSGKKDALAVGHSTRGNPLINGESTTIAEQDYRHGTRIIYFKDRRKAATTKKGYLKTIDLQQIVGQ